MADKIYVVTLKKKDDLDGFYSDMESGGFKLQMKRPISRNTHYYMTDDQAVALRDDSRVLAVELRPPGRALVNLFDNAVDFIILEKLSIVLAAVPPFITPLPI